MNLPDLPTVLLDLRSRLAARATPERAARERAYLKSSLEHLGASQPVIRDEAKALDARLPKLEGPALLAVAHALHGTRIHEMRAVAIALLERRRKSLSEAELLELIEFARRSPGWAYIDWLATGVLGDVVARLPSERQAVHLRAWAADSDFWIRRVALLAPLERLRHEKGDFALWTTLAVPMLGEKEFFIRKAIGWVLREVSKKRPALVQAFVETYGPQMSGLTRREATKYLPPVT